MNAWHSPPAARPTNTHTSRIALAAAAALAALASATASPAQACGGFACSASVPVVQVGEQVVYVIGTDGSLTMSVRILYTGAAPEFAWILPVPETPTITLGHEALFAAIEPPTRPSFSVSSRVEGTCRPYPTCEYPPPSGLRDCCVSDAPASDAPIVSSDGGPTIFAEGSVGPYETVVLGGGTTAEIIDWLMMRGYDIPTSMAPLLDGYVAAGQRFVALRLRNDASSSDIQPVTLGFGGVLPCLPIRLTPVATAPTLPITAYFLADSRVAPRNYSLVDTAYPASLYLGGSYTSWVASQVATLGGHAFATDFAGATPEFSISIGVPADISGLATETDLDVFMGAPGVRLYANDPLFAGLLARNLTPPAGIDALSYAQCISFNVSAVCGGAPVAFDPAGAVAAITEAIRQPLVDAAGWIADRPYLTRLSTTLTAADMTIDPEFVLDAGLDDVPNAHSAVRVTECNGTTFPEDARVRLDTDDDRTMELSPASVSPTNADYCARRGGWLPGMGPPPPPPPPPDAGIGRGGGCFVSHGRVRSLGAAAAVLLAAVALGRRRRSGE